MVGAVWGGPASQALLATAIAQASETVVITDLQGTIQYANPAFERISGYFCAEAIGLNPRVLRSGKHDAGFYREMWETLLRGDTWRGRFINRKKDGTLYDEEATISPVRNLADPITHFVAVKRDITRELELENGDMHCSQATTICCGQNPGRRLKDGSGRVPTPPPVPPAGSTAAPEICSSAG